MRATRSSCLLAIPTLAMLLGTLPVSAALPPKLPHVHLGQGTVLPADAIGVAMLNEGGEGHLLKESERSTWSQHVSMARIGANGHMAPLEVHFINSPEGSPYYAVQPVGSFERGARYRLSLRSSLPSTDTLTWDFSVDKLTWDEVMGAGQVWLKAGALQGFHEGDEATGRPPVVTRAVELQLPERARAWESGLIIESAQAPGLGMSRELRVECSQQDSMRPQQQFVRISAKMPGLWDSKEVSASAHVPLSCDPVHSVLGSEHAALWQDHLARKLGTTRHGLLGVAGWLLAGVASLVWGLMFGARRVRRRRQGQVS